MCVCVCVCECVCVCVYRKPPSVEEVEIFPCHNCIYHRCVDISSRKSFQFKENNKSMIWHYKRYCKCDSKSIIYILMCNTCEWFYLGQTANLKQRIRKHKSDVFHHQNSFCKKCKNIYAIVSD